MLERLARIGWMLMTVGLLFATVSSGTEGNPILGGPEIRGTIIGSVTIEGEGVAGGGWVNRCVNVSGGILPLLG